MKGERLVCYFCGLTPAETLLQQLLDYSLGNMILMRQIIIDVGEVQDEIVIAVQSGWTPDWWNGASFSIEPVCKKCCDHHLHLDKRTGELEQRTDICHFHIP